MQFMFVFVFFQKSTSVQAKSITVTEMRYVRTLKGLSLARVNRTWLQGRWEKV